MAEKLQREAHIPEAWVHLMRLAGIDIPGNIKEIKTPTEHSTETQKIILPHGMDKRVAAKELEAQWKNEESENRFASDFKGWNWQDVLIAVRRVTEREFGWMNGQDNFWTGNPAEIDIVVDVKDGKKTNERAFYGDFNITGWESARASIQVDRSGTVNVNIIAKRKYSQPITTYFNLIREQLETASIYRGKNIVVTAKSDQLNFEIIENKGSDKIVLNKREQLVIDTFVIDSLGERGKRCYLFTGDYGTGKTETAMHVGRCAVEQHGMSFFYLKDSTAFDWLLNQCKKYQPCIIFLEDVDEITAGEQRDSAMNKILNTLDGVQTKGNDLTVIFTTNHPERINSALLRPGRIDIMVKFENPDDEVKQEIYHAYFKDIPGADMLAYNDLARKTPNMQGAVVAEIAQRSVKLAKKQGTITEDIVEACIQSMAYQIELMTGPNKEPSKSEQFIKLFGELIAKKVWSAPEGVVVHKYVTDDL
jgi:AAA+ superfamily predicted ATPase